MLTCALTSEQRSHFDPRYKTEEKEVNIDPMARLSEWSSATRDAFVALEAILQTTAYDNSQRRGKPSNLSHDLLMMMKMIDEGIKTGDLGGTKPQKTRDALEKLVPLAQVNAEIAQALTKHFLDFQGPADEWSP